MKRFFSLTLTIVISSVLMTSTAMIRKGTEEKLFQQEHIDNVNRTIAERFSKTDCYEPNKIYRYINILYVAYYGDILDRNQLYKDVPNNVYSVFYRGKGKTRYLDNIALVCDNDGKLVAFVSEYGVVSCVSHYKETVFDDRQKLAYSCLEKDIYKLFNFYPMSGSRYIGIDNNDKKYVVDNNYKINEKTLNPITITPLDEMTDEEWKNSFNIILPLFNTAP